MNYKILKLSNGEEIIADIVEQEQGVTVNNPMIFIYSTMTDMSGAAVDVTFLKDWLSNSDEKNTFLKNDRIIIMTDASEKCKKIYENQKEQNEKSISRDIMDQDPSKIIEQLDRMVSEFMESSLPEPHYGENFNTSDDNLFDEQYQKRKKRRKKKQKNPMDSIIPKELQDRPMIYMNMIIPPEAIMNLVSSGILDAEILQKLLDETKKKNNFTGDEKSRDDFGNKLSDWNPDPQSDDYK